MLLSNIDVVKDLKCDLQKILKRIEELRAIRNNEKEISITSRSNDHYFQYVMPITEDLFTAIMLDFVSKRSNIIKELEKLNVTVDVK